MGHGKSFKLQNLGYGFIHVRVQTTIFTATANGDLTCYVCSLEDAVAHLNVTNSSRILTIEK